MTENISAPFARVKVYNGYGHTDNLVVYGHVLKGKAFEVKNYTSNTFTNIINLIRLFLVRPVNGAAVRLVWRGQQINAVSQKDGFFKLEWKSETQVAAGWHTIKVEFLHTDGDAKMVGNGKIFVPHITQYGFISDIDDTVLISHSGKAFKKLRTLFTRNPRSRKVFDSAARYYRLLAMAHTEPDIANPFFYVSSSEWNLYDYLTEFFNYNKLPEGIFLLNEIKKWHQLFKTGGSKHEGKLIRAVRILNAFPVQRFILLGDNSQSDPEIYKLIADRYPNQIIAIYIRNINERKAGETLKTFSSLKNKSIDTCLFKHNIEAMEHSRAIGLIDN